MSASFELDARNGGRLSSLKIDDFELIYNNPNDHPTSWGAYPMLPYAGRVDRGRFSFAGNEHRLEINHDPHAMHGIAFTSSWEEVGPDHLTLTLDDRWPFGGTASHRATLVGDRHEGRLELELAVSATNSAMPVMLGWHPWFNRRLSPAGASAELQIPDFEAVEMYEVDSSMIPTGKTVSPPDPGPWDHPFRSIGGPIEIGWESQLRLTLRSSCDHWVIYDRPDHALCVEPQSGPPDIFNGERFDVEPTVLEPGETLAHQFFIEWQTL